MTSKSSALMLVAAVGLAIVHAQGAAQGQGRGQRAAQGATAKPVTTLTSPVTGNAVAGKKLYYDHACYSCHGFNGETGARAFVPNWPANLATERSFIAFLRGRANLAPVQPSTSMPNYPVESLSGRAGGYRLQAGTAMPPLLLDEEEAIAIAVGLRTAAQASVAGIEETSVRALVKLEQVLPGHLRRRVSALGGATDTLPGGGPTVDPQALTTIASACRVHWLRLGCGSSKRRRLSRCSA